MNKDKVLHSLNKVLHFLLKVLPLILKKVLHISNIYNSSNKCCENLLKVLHLANATRFKAAL